MSQLSFFEDQVNRSVPEILVTVLGVKFQGFVSPKTNQVVFSQSGVARALKRHESTVRSWLDSKRFKSLRGKSFPRAKLLTEVNSRPITIVTQADLVVLVQIGSERGDPVAKSMQDASFATLLQESVDQVLGIERPREQYLTQGASLRQRAEYLHTYRSLKYAAFENHHGVKGLCMVNAAVSELAVPNALERRKQNPGWRKKCNKDETMRLTIGSAVSEKAVEASDGRKALENNMQLATERITKIYSILDKPF